jgi:hypothetical protein
VAHLKVLKDLQKLRTALIEMQSGHFPDTRTLTFPIFLYIQKDIMLVYFDIINIYVWVKVTARSET